MVINTAKKQMMTGKPTIGAICGTGAPLAAQILALAGFDYVIIDDQHGLWEPSAIVAAFQTIQLAGATAMARVRKNDFGAIGAMLDRGAMGIMVPLVNSVQDAQAAAYAARYPPRGGRSFGPYGCNSYGPDYPDWIDDELFLAVQIESREALERVDEIMEVEGVDGCWIGPNDLGRSMGLDLTKAADVEAHQAAIARILEGCKAAGKIPGIAFGPTKAYIEQGFLFLTPGSDIQILSAGADGMLKTVQRTFIDGTRRV